MTIHLYSGYDPRESVGWHVFVASVLDAASVPVCIRRLDGKGMPVGSNDFTFSRFLVPALQGFRGRAVFADGCDMLANADIAELDALFDGSKAVQVVQHADYRTAHRMKYVGTDMQCPNRDYPRKNWSSLMLINCEHQAWQDMSAERIERLVAQAPADLLALRWLPADLIGALPDRWNRLVDEGQPVDGAAICHWTAGIPAFPHYAQAPGADLWRQHRDRMLRAAS